MRRLLSLAAFLAVLVSGAASAATTFPFIFYIHDTTGQTADTPLTSTYQFASTAVGNNSNVVLKAANASTSTVFLGTVFAGASNGLTTLNPNFAISGLFQNLSMPPGATVVFTVNFSPTATGITTAYLQASYQVQQGSCSFTSNNPVTQCPSGLGLAATLNGVATQPQLVLTYAGASGSVTPQSGAVAAINFGNVSLSASSAITFTLANQSNIALATPSISVPAPTTFASNPFSVVTSQVPASLAAGASANFVITFAPGQTGVVTTSLIVGSNTYLLQGAGIVIADIDALQISYVDSTGVRGLPQAATPISFGQVVAGSSSASATLAFTITNPTTSYNAVSIPTLTLTGSNFTMTGLSGASSFPASLAPGATITFNIVFSPGAAGTYTGSLAVGSRVFSLTGLSVTPPLPSFSLQVTPTPLTSQQQGTVTIQLASASTLNLVGQLTLTFTPSVTNVTDDPAIMFLANSGRQISVSVATGQITATYNGQSALAFQTGTTAGTITFSVTFPNTATYTQSYTITPALPQITSATTLRSSPNLLVTVVGYDNTYSIGPLSFTFYDTSGNTISPVQINAAASFQQLFFTNNTAGGAFQFQATFPVTGDVTKVGSVAITVSNSVGQTTSTQNFQ